MNPPPPMLPASGSTTASAKPTATAASTALPPCFRTSTPASLASGCADTTMALGAITGAERVFQVAGRTRRPEITAGRAARLEGDVSGPDAPPHADASAAIATWLTRRRRIDYSGVDPRRGQRLTWAPMTMLPFRD